MADLADVLNALVNICAQVVYPNGTANPSIANVPVNFFPGWPVASSLDQSVRTGNITISVFPTPTEKITTRYFGHWEPISLSTPTINLVVNGQLVTISGNPAPGQTVMIIVNGTGYAYTLQANDTLASIASNLAAIIPNSSASNNTLTVNNAAQLAANLSVSGISGQELKRQSRLIMITVWAQTNDQRNLIIAAIDQVLAATHWITLPDGYAARVTYHSSHVEDKNEKVQLYKRDLYYNVEYATTITEQGATIADTYVTTPPVGG